MLQNKIYQNYTKEILKIFFTILLGLSLIAWTVRAVNFLDLIVESGYPIITYFQYSVLNIMGILVKFIPLSFLLALTLFVLRQIQENEFIILWTTGVKKIQLVHLFLLISIFITIFYIIFSTLITPYALNKSRQLLSNENETYFLPTVKAEQFNDSFSGLTFIVDKKFKNEIKNVFLQDKQNILKNISSEKFSKGTNAIIAAQGIVEKNNLILLNGSIISSDKQNLKNNIIKFEQLNLSLNNLTNTTIKQPKIQETSTIGLLNCYRSKFINEIQCKNFKKEILPVINRRIILPLFIPLITVISSLLLIKNKKNIFLNNTSVFLYSFFVLLYAELIIRYTGINYFINLTFIFSPLILCLLSYFYIRIKFSKEINEQ
jgi:lipopolysaccharide export system permease protein